MKKFFIIGGVIILLAIVVLLGIRYLSADNKNIGGTLYFAKTASDIIGTKTGTSTTPYHLDFGDQATSSVISRLGNSITEATYTIQATKASSTKAAVFIQILGTQDDYCDEATTTTATLSYDQVTTYDLNWFDITPHILNWASTSTIDVLGGVPTGTGSMLNGTTTLIWNPKAWKQGTTLTLKDLNYECIRFDVNGTSTDLWVQLRTR